MKTSNTQNYSEIKKIYAFYGLGKTYLAKQNKKYFDYDKFYRLDENEIPTDKIILTNDLTDDVDLIILPKDPISRLSKKKKVFFEQYPNLLTTEYADAKTKDNVIILEDNVIILEDDEYLSTYLNKTIN